MRIGTSEVKAAARTLLRHRGFTTVAVLSLALAIGINTTMYTTLDAMFNPRSSIRSPERLYRVGFFGDFRHRLDARTRNTMLTSGVEGFEGVTGSWLRHFDALLESRTSHRSGWVASVAPNFFAVLGVRPVVGRLLSEQDVGASTPSVILSERAVRDLFPKRANPIGERIEIQGEAHIVVGVLDRASDFVGNRTVAWTLPAPDVDPATLPLSIVRLREGAAPADVERALKVVSNRIAFEVGEAPRDNSVRLLGINRNQFSFGAFQTALVGAVVAVLLVACANIANLQLARGIARSRELATRAALGASRRDLIAHLLVESGLLAAAGLALGLLLTFWGMHVIRASIPETIGEYIVEPQTSWRLFAFAAITAGVCMLLIGLVPAIRVSRVNLNELIKRGAGTGSMRAARRQYGYLIAAEIGFALVVLCGAALLVRSALQLEANARAWDQSMLANATARLNLQPGERRELAGVGAEVVARLRGHADVADAAVLLRRGSADKEITATDPGGKQQVVPVPMWTYAVVSPSYLRVMGFEIAHGRDFLEGERGPVVIVSPQMARRLWPSTNAIGQMIKFGSPKTPGRWYTVVGVRKPVGLESVDSAAASGVGPVYVLATGDDVLTGANASKSPEVGIVVRARRNPHRLPILIRRAFAGDSRQSITHASAFDRGSFDAARRANHRFVGALFSVFAVLSLGLAALGIYGIVAHSVAERRREIGVRIALGSSARDILYVVLREGNVFALAGIAIGLALIRKSAPLLSNFLPFPEIDIYSIELYIPMAIFFFAVAVTAALVPALRATGIDPVEALRCE
ncbi:MAG TPA: FtsX-like permease family protein [Gemmatimonadaceae bacterium]